MGKTRIERNRSKTLPSSPSHSFSSSSSSDFEFLISISPRKSSTALCPADELFYKGQLLPLHISPRISMVSTLLSASSSSSSSTATSTTSSRDSSSSTDSSSSSFTSDLSLLAAGSSVTDNDNLTSTNKAKPSKYFSLSRILKKDPPKSAAPSATKMSPSVKEVIRKYLMKVKPFFEKLSQSGGATVARTAGDRERRESGSVGGSTLFSTGSLKCPRVIRRRYVASCPSSMRSSPSHSGVLARGRISGRVDGLVSYSSDKSTMDELQNSIQGAIAHCKNSASFSNHKSSNGNKCKVKERE